MKHQQHEPTKVNLALQQAIGAILGDRPIAYHAILARALGSASAGILLSQLLYWQPRSQDTEGWFWKTQGQIYEETALTRSEQETARKVLGAAGILEEKRAGVPARLHFRINITKLAELLSRYQARVADSNRHGESATPTSHQFAGILQSSVQETSRQEFANPSDKRGAFPLTNTETTTENSPETTTFDVVEAAHGENDAIGRQFIQTLVDFGVSRRAAHRLITSFSEAHIQDKLDLAEFLVRSKSPLVANNPAGYLVKAIEEDYSPSVRGYRPKAEREVKERDSRARLEQAAEAHRRLEHEASGAEQTRQTQLRKMYPAQVIAGTHYTTESAWQGAKALLQSEFTGLNAALIDSCLLLAVKGGIAELGAPHKMARQRVEEHFRPSIERALREVLGRPLTLEVSLLELLTSDLSPAHSDNPGPPERGRIIPSRKRSRVTGSSKDSPSNTAIV